MLLPATRTRKKGSFFFLAWIWLVTTWCLVAVTTAQLESLEVLHPNSETCDDINNTTVHCVVTDNSKEYWLDNFKWKAVKKMIIENASRLYLQDPLCSSGGDRLVEIHNSDRVTTVPGPQHCWHHLSLHDCRDVTIEDGADQVQMFSSMARKIILPAGNRFVLEDSQVGEVSVAVDSNVVTVKNSRIAVVTSLVMNGTVQVTMEDSTLSHVEGFIYNADRDVILNNVTMETVASNGFMVQHSLELQNSMINSVERHGIQVWPGATLTLQDCVAEWFDYDSIVISEGSTIHLNNVTLGHLREIDIQLSDASLSLYPLVSLDQDSISLAGWVAIAVFIGVTVGGLIGMAAATFVIRRREASTRQADDMELQTHVLSTSQNTFSPMDQTTPTPPSTQPPPTPRAQRPPVPLPHEGSAVSRNDNTLAKPDTLTAPQKDKFKTTGKDDRDALPMPPPPPMSPAEDEELYDDVQGPQASLGANLRALTSNRPKLPPPITRQFQ